MENLTVKNLYKIFGSNPSRAIELIERGHSKEKILEETGLTVGVDNANFSVKPGETFVIMGLSGSGKSTLVRCINRLIDPTRGEITLGDKNIVDMDKKDLREIRRTTIGMVFQNFALLPNRTVLGNVEYGLEIQGIGREERQKKSMESLELVGLKGYEHSHPDQLSGGMKQRVGLARALANDPKILLMDEPFSALDPLIRADMQDELIELQEEMQKTIIFITHDLDEALKMGDRIMLMKDGKTVQTGTAEEILTKPADDYVARFVQGVNRSDIFTAQDIMNKPWTTVGKNHGPRLALKEMRKYGTESLFVVGDKRRLEGVVFLDDVAQAIKEGDQTLQNVIKVEEINSVTPDTNISDLIELTVTSTVPVTVVDENKRLLGVIVKGSVLEALIPEGGELNND